MNYEPADYRLRHDNEIRVLREHYYFSDILS